MSGLFSGILTFVNFLVACFALALIVQLLSSKGKIPKEDGEPIAEHLRPTVDRRNSMLKSYLEAVNTGNHSILTSCCTPAFAEEIRSKAAIYNKVRIHKEISFIPSKETERTFENATIDVDVLLTTYETITGSYTEKYIDMSTGKVIDELKQPKSTVVLRLSANDEGLWVISGMNVERTSKIAQNPIVIMLSALIAPIIFSPLVLSFFVNFNPMIKSFVSFFNIAIWVIAIFSVLVIVALNFFNKKVEKKVANISHAYRIADNASWLVKRLCAYRELNPAGAEAILYPEAFTHWCKGYSHEGQFILDCRPVYNKLSISTATNENGTQIASLLDEVELTILGVDRKISRTTRNLSLQLASFDYTNPHIIKLDSSVLMDWGGKTYGDASLL